MRHSKRSRLRTRCSKMRRSARSTTSTALKGSREATCPKVRTTSSPHCSAGVGAAVGVASLGRAKAPTLSIPSRFPSKISTSAKPLNWLSPATKSSANQRRAEIAKVGLRVCSLRTVIFPHVSSYECSWCRFRFILFFSSFTSTALLFTST